MAENQTMRGTNAKFWSCPENQPKHPNKGARFVPHGLSILQEGRRQAAGGISAKQPRPSKNGRLRGRQAFEAASGKHSFLGKVVSSSWF